MIGAFARRRTRSHFGGESAGECIVDGEGGPGSPPSGRRRAEESPWVRLALEDARACGVTRLAELTGLDVLGVPVFQAVRPWGRSLSVHQGKGLTPEAARIGALMEAVEIDHAETIEAETRHCAFEDLDPAERAPTLLDFARDRALPPDPRGPMAWIAAGSPGADHRLWVPFEMVSADFTRTGDPKLERSSNGLGARFDAEGAALKALLELIERDADAAWRARPPHERSWTCLETASITCPGFQDLRGRARDRGIFLSLHHLAAVVPLPVIVCEIHEPAAGPARRRRAAGVGCGFTAEAALWAAVTEAAQSRLTVISGARDDIPPAGAPAAGAHGLGLAPPLSMDRAPTPWDAVLAAGDAAPAASVAGLAEGLARAGYPVVGLVDLSRPGQAARVVKAVVPGLGAFGRARRPPAPRSP
jgi:ribosomal protein S12 methylthiotransferase accessory factor